MRVETDIPGVNVGRYTQHWYTEAFHRYRQTDRYTQRHTIQVYGAYGKLNKHIGCRLRQVHSAQVHRYRDTKDNIQTQATQVNVTFGKRNSHCRYRFRQVHLTQVHRRTPQVHRQTGPHRGTRYRFTSHMGG